MIPYFSFWKVWMVVSLSSAISKKGNDEEEEV